MIYIYTLIHTALAANEAAMVVAAVEERLVFQALPNLKTFQPRHIKKVFDFYE